MSNATTPLLTIVIGPKLLPLVLVPVEVSVVVDSLFVDVGFDAGSSSAGVVAGSSAGYSAGSSGSFAGVAGSGRVSSGGSVLGTTCISAKHTKPYDFPSSGLSNNLSSSSLHV